MKKSVALVLLVMSCLLAAVTPIEAKQGRAARSTILMVLTGVDHVPGTDHETGFWAEEFVAPYELFRKAGHKVIVASVEGGFAPVDPRSIDPANVGEEQARELRLALDRARPALKTVALNDVRLDRVAAVFVVGGHGVMWDLTDSAIMHKIAQHIYCSGGVVAAVCHGPGALVRAMLPDGRYLLDGKRVTGFSAREEELAGMAKIVPYCLEVEMNKASGNRYECGEPWKSFVVVDENVVTGQNPASSADTARAVLELLSAARRR